MATFFVDADVAPVDRIYHLTGTYLNTPFVDFYVRQPYVFHSIARSQAFGGAPEQEKGMDLLDRLSQLFVHRIRVCWLLPPNTLAVVDRRGGFARRRDFLVSTEPVHARNCPFSSQRNVSVSDHVECVGRNSHADPFVFL